jgi:hypothetical protein
VTITTVEVNFNEISFLKNVKWRGAAAKIFAAAGSKRMRGSEGSGASARIESL